MFANEKLPDQHYGFKTLLIDYFNHNNEKQSFCSTVCISMRICLLRHLTHTDFHWGHTYPSCGMRTRALGRSSIEELTMVSRKSPSGWATWFKKKKRGSKKPHIAKSPAQLLSMDMSLYGHLLYRLIWKICPISSQNELFPPLTHVIILTGSDRGASTACAPIPRTW